MFAVPKVASFEIECREGEDSSQKQKDGTVWNVSPIILFTRWMIGSSSFDDGSRYLANVPPSGRS